MRGWDMYLLHFSESIGQARHYLGICRAGRLLVRVSLHRAGKGASLTRAVVERGGSLEVAAVWWNVDIREERRFKTSGGLHKRCPICSTPREGRWSMPPPLLNEALHRKVHNAGQAR